VSYNKLGDLWVSLGEPARAREQYEQALALSEELRRRAPDSAEYARGVLSARLRRTEDCWSPTRARAYFRSLSAGRTRMNSSSHS